MSRPPIFNPLPTYPFCEDQLEVFTFMGQHGFMGIVFDMVQGFMPQPGETTLSQFGSWVFVEGGAYHYEAVESVPELVARYADMKKRRAEAAAAAAKVTVTTGAPSVWKQKG
jgi:hypothetical protein